MTRVPDVADTTHVTHMVHATQIKHVTRRKRIVYNKNCTSDNQHCVSGKQCPPEPTLGKHGGLCPPPGTPSAGRVGI